jgi:hypothetical protein
MDQKKRGDKDKGTKRRISWLPFVHLKFAVINPPTLEAKEATSG